MNGQYSKRNVLGQLAIVLHAHLPYVRKNEKNSLEEDWLFQAILECYILLLQSIELPKIKILQILNLQLVYSNIIITS